MKFNLRFLFLLLFPLFASVNSSRGEEVYEYVFNSLPFDQKFTGGSTKAVLNGVSWIFVSAINYVEFGSANNGLHICAASDGNKVKEYKLVTSGIRGEILSLEISATSTQPDASATDFATLNVTVNGVSYGSYSLSNTLVSPFLFTPSSSPSAGEIVLSFNQGKKTNYGMYIKSIKITYLPGSNTLVLDENADNSEGIGGWVNNTVDVTLNRTFTADGGWYTLCLPFAVSAQETGRVFGEGTDVERLASSVQTASTTTAVFSSVDGMEAGHVYLIKPTQSVSNPVFSGVTLSAPDPVPTEVEGCTFSGVYSPYTVPAERGYCILAGSDGTHLQGISDDGTQLKGTRGYFHFSAASANEARVMLSGLTPVERIDADVCPASSGIYSVQGVRMREGSDLPAGIYIRGGRKYVVKR